LKSSSNKKGTTLEETKFSVVYCFCGGNVTQHSVMHGTGQIRVEAGKERDEQGTNAKQQRPLDCRTVNTFFFVAIAIHINVFDFFCGV
jgi:hypothetical protein